MNHESRIPIKLILVVGCAMFFATGIASAQTWSSTDADPPAQRNQPFGQQNGISSGTEVYVYPGGQSQNSQYPQYPQQQYPQYQQNQRNQYGQQYPQQQYPQQRQQQDMRGNPQYPNGNYQAYPQQRSQGGYQPGRGMTEDEWMARQREQAQRDRMQGITPSGPARLPTQDEQARAVRDAIRQSDAANDAARRTMEAEARKRRGLSPQ